MFIFEDDVIIHHIHSNYKFAILHIISTIILLVQLMLHSVFKFPLERFLDPTVGSFKNFFKNNKMFLYNYVQFSSFWWYYKYLAF